MWINRRRFVKQNSPLMVKAQFIIICVCILLEIYLYALPADYMYDVVSSCELILVIRCLNPFARVLEKDRQILRLKIRKEKLTIKNFARGSERVKVSTV